MDRPSGPPRGPLQHPDREPGPGPDPDRPPQRGGLRGRPWALLLGALAVLSALAVTGLLLSRTGGGPDRAASPDPPGAATPATAGRSPAPPPTPATGTPQAPGRTPGAVAAEFSGTGHQSTGNFTTPGGLALVTASCPACRLAFTVTVLDAGGRAKAVPVIAFGPYEGTRAATLPPGAHYLKVDADSAWTVRLGPPPGGAPAALPQAYAGRGDRLAGPFTATGTLRAEGSHTGAGHFVVHVLDADGGLVDLPFNAVGDHRSTATSRLHGPGPYYLDVTALGAWTLRLSGG